MRAGFVCLAIAASLPWTASPAGAAPKNPPPALVVAESPTVEVPRGGQRRIMLKGIERHNNLLRYEIVAPPRHGKLSAVDEPDPNRQGPAFVVYSHDDDETSLTDAFSYRVTAPISRRGATGTVTINITDAPPRLGAPGLLAFTAVVGESGKGVLSLTNLGGGVLRGEVRVPEPFHVEGSGLVELGRGRSTNITIHFTPLKPGLTPPEKIQPAPHDNPGAAVSLVGEGTPPFAVKTTSGELRLRSDDAREAVVDLVNLSSHPQTITAIVKPPELVDPLGDIILNPGETREATLRIPPEKRSGPEKLSVTFSTPLHGETRSFSAPPVPPRLEVLTTAVDFTGARETGFVVENSGGVEGRFELTLPEGIVSIEGATSFAVPPGAQTTVRLRQQHPEDDEPGIIFRHGAAEPVRIPVATMPKEPDSSPPAPPAPTPPPPRWVLNEDIRLEQEAPEILRLVFLKAKDGWANPRLELQEADPADWLPFIPPAQREEEQGFFAVVYGKIMGFFGRLTQRPGSEVLDEIQSGNTTPETWIAVPLGNEDALSGKAWRLTADGNEPAGKRSVVTVPFRIAAGGMTLQAEEASPRPAQPAPQPAESRPAAPSRSKHEWIGLETTRTTALLQLALASDPEVTDYRLERLATVMVVDPATGRPRLPEVKPIEHEGETRILSVEQTKSNGKDVAVVTASISDLVPGSGTTWRLVPLAGTAERPPTDEFFVRTLPAWQFPWQTFWLATAFILLAVVFYVRWKSRQPTG